MYIESVDNLLFETNNPPTHTIIPVFGCDIGGEHLQRPEAKCQAPEQQPQAGRTYRLNRTSASTGMLVFGISSVSKIQFNFSYAGNLK